MNKPLVVFDLYGTLVDWKLAIGSFIEFYVSRDAVEDFFKCDIREVASYRPYKEILVHCLREVAERRGIQVPVELAEAFIVNFARSPPFPDTVYGLKLLRKHGFKLAVLSNTDRDLIEITLKGFRELFDYVVTAEDVKAYKPSLEAFKRAYETLGVTAREVVHVSAHTPYDLEPASKLGAKTILVDRGLGYDWPTKVKSLTELPRALEGLI